MAAQFEAVPAQRSLTLSPRIAIVDDDPLLRELLVDYLTGQGYSALPCDGGVSLRTLFASSPPDCVILDLVMPDEDGLSVLRWLRAGSDVPLIMLTSSDALADRIVGLELGADDYVAKPADLRELLARVRSVLRRLQSGEVMAVLPDVRMRTEAVGVRFLGGTANLGAGMAHFARLAKVPIVPCIILREGWTRHRKILLLSYILQGLPLHRGAQCYPTEPL